MIENRTIKEGIFENYVYGPVRSFFSFGYQEAEEERLKQERIRFQEYLKKSKKFEEDLESGKIDENLKYPGYDEN